MREREREREREGEGERERKRERSRQGSKTRSHFNTHKKNMSSHLSKMKLSHVFLSVRLRYRYQLPIDANLILYPSVSMIERNTCTDKSTC